MAGDEFLARDAYRVWKRRVKDASGSVWVFTPYLDHMLVRLLSNVALPTSAVCVVTDLSPESSPANYRKKLLALRYLLSQGVMVRTLPRLHAKVLVVDEGKVTVGSQNFTSYARDSREATTVPELNLSGTGFMDTLEQWLSSAAIVELEYVERLLERLKEPSAALDLAHQALVEAFNHEERLRLERLAAAERARRAAERARAAAGELRKNDARERESIARGLHAALTQTRYRSPQGAAYAEFVTLESRSGSGWVNHEYESLVADNMYDLTRWYDGDGTSTKVVELRRLNYYPLILYPSGRIAFARIAKTRITYVKSGVRFTSPKRVGARNYFVTLNFPKDLDRGANIDLKLRGHADSPTGYRFLLRYDGESVEIAWEEPNAAATSGIDAMKAAGHEALDNPPDAARFLASLFDPITFSRVGLDEYNAVRFFGRGRYRLDVIEAGGSRIFVARPS